MANRQNQIQIVTNKRLWRHGFDDNMCLCDHESPAIISWTHGVGERRFLVVP